MEWETEEFIHAQPAKWKRCRAIHVSKQDGNKTWDAEKVSNAICHAKNF